MSIFKTIFGSKKEDKSLNWKILDDSNQLNEISSLSNQKPVVIFKHSTRCGISRMVLNQFQNNADFDEDAVVLLYLDLLENRDISNTISKKFGVLHQSPQMIIIKDGVVIHHASHSAIVPSTINNILAST